MFVDHRIEKEFDGFNALCVLNLNSFIFSETDKSPVPPSRFSSESNDSIATVTPYRSVGLNG